jgi:NADPH-dependent curcumin reductase CurA
MPANLEGVNRRILLRSRPTGRIDGSVFELVEEPVPEPSEGEALVRNLYLSLDPTNRVWISEVPSYLPPVEIGAVMRSGGIGRVVASNSDLFAVGDLVSGLVGWQDYVVAGRGEAAAVQKVPSDLPVPIEAMMGVLGVTGYTAYFGMEIGQPTEGETVVVSAAAGAVGSIAGQIARIHGARAVGIVGSDEKCSFIVNELGYDAAVNRRAPDWREQLATACPNGVDVDFENAGGEIMDEVFGMLNLRARVVLCGLISQYNEAAPTPGPTNFPRLLSNRVRLEGFIILDYWDRFPEAAAQLGVWVADGKLRHRDTVVDGLEKAPDAINMLFDGDNVGKLLVKVADDPA